MMEFWKLVHLEACFLDWKNYCDITFAWFNRNQEEFLRNFFITAHNSETCPYYKEYFNVLPS